MTDLWKIRIGTTDYDIQDSVARAGLDGKIDIQQATTDVGKALVVGSDGKVTPQSISPGGAAVWGGITGTLSNQTDLQTALNNKQEALSSGVNIKTINNQSVLGAGNIEISGGSSSFASLTGEPTDNTKLAEALDGKIQKVWTSTEEGYLFKVVLEDGKYIAKPVQGSTASVGFGDLTGQPSDNSALSSVLNTKVTKDGDKVLSTNDFTNGYKSLLDNLDTSVSAKITAHNSVLNAHETLFATKLNKEYTSAEEGYILKIVEESGKYVAKAVNGGTTSVGFADLTGDPEDNDNLKDALEGKASTMFYIPPIANMVKDVIDSEGIYQKITWTLPNSFIVNGQPAMWTSELSDGTSPKYTKRTFKVYDSDKTTLLQTVTFTRSYDANGVLKSEVMNE